MLNKFIVEEGYKRNIIVFDAEATPGVFGSRLAALLRTVAHRNVPRGHLEAVYVPEEITVDDEDGALCGLYIIPDKRLNKGGELLEHFKKIGGSTAASLNSKVDEYLVVGVGQNIVMLGSMP